MEFTCINNLTYKELELKLLELGFEKYRTDQVFTSIHKKRAISIEEIKGLSKSHKDILNNNLSLCKPEIERVFESENDETKKILIKLNDGNIIETVLMKYSYGYSQCISTQVGCRMGCSFCASTRGGLIRNLEAYELLEQIYLIEDYFNVVVSNITLMGSGEPLDNLENVLKFLEIVNNEKGKNISMRSITLSTCGVVPGIYELAKHNLPIALSVSLHSPTDRERSLIMPINKKYNLEELKKALCDYQSITNRRITFEYTLIEGVNDTKECANRIHELTKRLKCHVNLIPLNPIKEYNEKRPEKEKLIKFRDLLSLLGVNVTIRRELGSDISASCGQLRVNYLEENRVIR